MKRVFMTTVMVALSTGTASSQSADGPTADWKTLLGPKAAFTFKDLSGDCTCLQRPDTDIMSTYPDILSGDPRRSHIAQVPGYAYDEGDPLTSRWATTCQLAGQELRGSAERFSLCNATPSGVRIDIMQASGSLRIVLGPNSFVSIQAQSDGTQVIVNGHATRYAVVNGRVYSLENALAGGVTLNQFPVP